MNTRISDGNVAITVKRGGGERMKKVIGIALVLLLACAVVASADLTNWVMKIQAFAADGSSSGGGLTQWGWKTGGYTDALDASENAQLNPPFGTDTLYYVQAMNNGTLCKFDYKAPDGVLPKTWVFNIYSIGPGPAAPMKVTIGTTASVLPWASLPAGSFLQFSGAYDHKYTSADWLPASTNLTFDVMGMPGAGNPAVLTVTLAVPEPGSMLALGSGLVGLMGFAIRRRR